MCGERVDSMDFVVEMLVHRMTEHMSDPWGTSKFTERQDLDA